MYKFQKIIFLVLIHFIAITNAQQEYLKNALESVDQIIDQKNTGLYNGTRYVEYFRTINEHHKFFKSSEFLAGSLIYGDQYYGNVNLKYDLNADDLLLDIQSLKKFPILKLYKSRISEFYLDGNKFININSNTTQGFHQVLWNSDDLKLLKKHKKQKLKRFSKKTVYYEFYDENNYFFEYKNEVYPLNKRGDLLKVFPKYKKEIKQIYNKQYVKNNPEANYILIFGELLKSLENENN